MINKIDNIIKSLSFEFPYTSTEWAETMLMENYHSHSSFSNVSTPDSPTNMDKYAERIKELGAKCLYSGEHGSQGNHMEVYTIAEASGLKYVHSTEAYWVKDRHEKDNMNCHICIIGLNSEARRELNYILSIANEDGYYYKPRIDLELILGLNPADFIVTSACVAGWSYEDADDVWLKIAGHFKENFFFEVQPHHTDKQKALNKHILELSEKYNIDIICGLDSHYIESDGSIKRDKILEYKNISYPEEEGWFMDYPDGKTVYKRFIEQGILSEEQILRAMMNTNVFVVKCQEIVLNKTFKIPNIYRDKTYDERVQLLKDILNDRYLKEKLQTQDKIKGIQYEVEQIVDSGVIDYFLFNEALIREAVTGQGGILTTTSRGSAASFIINKLLGFTTIDRFSSEIPIYPERFLTKERIQAGQMPDIDFNIAEQEPFVKAARKLLGEHSCYPLMAIEVMKEKAAWQMYASVAGIAPQTANEISTYIDKYNDALKYADDEDKQFIQVEKYIPAEYIEIYKQSKEYQNIVINLKVHACGHLIFDGDIRREIGLISAVSQTTKERKIVACIEGKYLDDFGYVKDDFLIVDSVALTHECFDALGKPVPSFDQLREMIKGDKATWDIYEKGITCCVNQLEKQSTAHKAMKYKPKTLAELSAFIAGIRPGFASLLPRFLNREDYTTGETKIDELLSDSYSYMLYQESIMKVLSFLGLPMGDCYGIIKSISKKKLKGEKKKKLKKELITNWEQIFGNTNNFNNVWNVIEDSARYAFNAPHALSMGGDSAYLAWFKAHHTSVFYQTAVNHYLKKKNKNKMNDLINEARNFYSYRVVDYKFGDDNREVNINDDTKKIYPAMSLLKGIQAIAPHLLYSIRDAEATDEMGLIKLLSEVTYEGDKINKTTLSKLIKIGYFDKFGDINRLLQAGEIFKAYGKRSTLPKPFEYDISEFCGKETAKQYRELDNMGICKHILNSMNIPTATDLEKISYQLSIIGSTSLIVPDEPMNHFALIKIDKGKFNTFFKLYRIYDGIEIEVKVDKKYFESHPIDFDFYEKFDKVPILKCSFTSKQKRRKIDDKWVATGEYESILSAYTEI